MNNATVIAHFVLPVVKYNLERPQLEVMIINVI